jgi:hypothetical protein
MAVDWNAAVDDDGSGTTGTILDKAEMSALLRGTVVPDTNISTVHNWPPTLAPGRTLITWFGSSDFLCTGLANGSAGQVVTVKNTGGKVAYFAHQSASSAAQNRFVNIATSAPTPIATGGWVTYQHDGAVWRLIGHQQGIWIAPGYSAAWFTATGGTWNVEVGDLATYAYWLDGATLTFSLYINASSVGGSPSQLLVALPAGFICLRAAALPVVWAPAGANEMAFASMTAPGTTVGISRVAGGFSVTTNTTYGYFVLTFEVQ